MNITINKFAAIFSLALIMAASAFGQATMTQTTLSSAVAAPSSGTTNVVADQFVNLASATGVTAPGSLGQPTTILFIDQEAMSVISVNGTYIGVLRGAQGTQVRSHASSALVWVGTPGQFLQFDPSGSCTASAISAVPAVSIPTGNVFNCKNSLWVQDGGYYFVSPSSCGSAVATTAYAAGSPITTAAATGNLVYSVTTNTTAGTVEVTCPLLPPSNLLGKPVVIYDASLLYGVQTTALTSIAAATVKKVTYPASTAAGVAAAGTVAAAGGTLTQTPTTLQLTTTTTGQCFDEKLVFGTPFIVNADVQALNLDQVFTTAGTTATTLQVCGVIVHYGQVQPPATLP